MAGRRYGSDVSTDRYDDRREYPSRNGRSRGYDDRYPDEDVAYRRGPPVRERDTGVREEYLERDRQASTPAYLREDYGRPTAGAMVLRKRETEDFEFAPRPRRRSPSPEPERTIEKEEIIIRRDESEQRPPIARDRSRDGRDREEIIIRRDDRDRSRDGRDREEIIIRRDEREDDGRLPVPRGGGGDRSREEIIIRRDEKDDVASRLGDDRRISTARGADRSRIGDDRRSVRGGDVDREEIIIRRNDRDSDDRDSRIPSRRYDDYPSGRPISHERARGRAGSDSEQEIIIRRDERDGRNGDRERQEIIIRRSSHSRSPSPTLSSVRHAPEPPAIYAPPIHQEVITHHRHIDHGYDLAVANRSRPISRPPSPPMPPQSRDRSEERIEIHRSGERNGRPYDEDIVIDRNDGRSTTPLPLAARERDPYYGYPPRRDRDRDRDRDLYQPNPRPSRPYDRDVQEEADYYNNRARDRGYVGEGYNGATQDWAIVDVPPGTRRVRMDGAGGGGQEITWQKYNGVRRSQFIPDSSDEGYGSELGRPFPPAAGGDGGRRYGRDRDSTEGLWTEITKDLVVKEAIQEMGYEYEETDEFYYIISYLRYEDVARLVGLSDDIRKDRRKRMREIEWESRALPPPAIEEPTPRLAIEGPPSMRPLPQDWDREDERYIEREVVYRGGRPPPPPQWRR